MLVSVSPSAFIAFAAVDADAAADDADDAADDSFNFPDSLRVAGDFGSE